MALPSIPVSHFTIKKSDFVKKNITMRPFLTGEETILLRVKDSEDQDEIMTAMKQVVNQCIVEPKDVTASNVPSFVLELMFLRLRQNSNGEIVPLEYKCKNMIEVERTLGPKECGTTLKVDLDLRNSDVAVPEGHRNVFEVGGGLGIKLNYPSLEVAESLEDDKDWTETIAALIDSVYSADEVWLAKDETKAELLKFCSGISTKVRKEIQKDFLDKLPTIKSKLTAVCPGCGHVHEIELEGLQDHFN